MKFTKDLAYDADIDKVFGMFCDEEYVKDKYTALGHRNIEIVEFGESEDGLSFVIKTQRDVDVDAPGFAKKILPATNRVVQTDTWSLEEGEVINGTWKVEVAGVPANLGGNTVLIVDGDTCINRIDGEIKVNVPLIGGKIADFIGGDTVRTIDAEHEFSAKYVHEAYE